MIKIHTKCPLDILQKRAFLMAKIREYFLTQNVLEVETPILSSSGNTDININSFTSDSITLNQPKSYLRTSPEFPLKRLLALGVGDVFELGKVFRKGEKSRTHNVEFTMLEWYRINFNYKNLIQDVIGLFEFLLPFYDVEIDGFQEIEYVTCFKQFMNMDINTTDVDQLNQICKSTGYCGSSLRKDEALDFLFATKIQPEFDKNSVTFVTLYPSSQAALAQINPDDRSTAFRFEVFFQGHELGNGYQELTNAKEMLQRFKNDNCYRKNNHLEIIAIDYNLISATQEMPKCSGIAVGFDRLLMTLLGKESIALVVPFEAHEA